MGTAEADSSGREGAGLVSRGSERFRKGSPVEGGRKSVQGETVWYNPGNGMGTSQFRIGQKSEQRADIWGGEKV